MAFKRIKTITKEEPDGTTVTVGTLYYDSNSGNYEVRSEKSKFKRLINDQKEVTIYKNGFFQPGYSQSFGIKQIDDIEDTVYKIKKKIGFNANLYIKPDDEQANQDFEEVANLWSKSNINDPTELGQLLSNSLIESGSSDTLLKSFGILKYPIDGDYGNTQDYMKITQRKYSPVRRGLFAGEGKPLDTFANGVVRDNPAGEIINMIKLPIPNTLTDSNNIAWGQDTMNAMSAAIAGAVSKVVNPKNIDALVNDFGGTLQEGVRGVRSIGNPLSEENRSAMMSSLRTILNNENMQTVATAGIGSKILGILGQNMSAESILARGQGIIPNSNLELLFNSPALRKFSFTWRMSPRSREEAMVVNKIIRSFKQGMAAKKINPTSGGASFFLGTPNVFDLEFKTGGDELIDGLFRVKTSACTNASISYTDGAQWSAYDDGQPTSINLTLAFEELEPIFDTDYSENPLTDGLAKIPDTSIGY